MIFACANEKRKKTGCPESIRTAGYGLDHPCGPIHFHSPQHQESEKTSASNSTTSEEGFRCLTYPPTPTYHGRLSQAILGPGGYCWNAEVWSLFASRGAHGEPAKVLGCGRFVVIGSVKYKGGDYAQTVRSHSQILLLRRPSMYFRPGLSNSSSLQRER
jgi:hypothetical protein